MRDGAGRYGRVVLVGATSEIGLAVLRHLSLQPGADVILAARDPDRARAAVTGLPQRLHLEVVDLDLEQLRVDPAGTCSRWFAGGDVDLLIPAFGVLGDQARAETEPSSASEVLGVNLTTQAVLLLEASRRMRAQGHGTLVVLSSIAAVRPRRANFLYGASKAGLDAFARGLADSLHGTGVDLLLVRPGFVIGRMTAGMPAAPLSVEPEAVGVAVANAVRRGRRLVWVPAPLAGVAAVLRLVPRPLWRRLRR